MDDGQAHAHSAPHREHHGAFCLDKYISERIRRFTSEALCPRGVWAKHIAALTHDPELGLQILEPLRSDTSRYVQDSVANWINDASKTQPEWVGQFADRWLQESPTPETTRIVSRGLRSIRD